MILDSPQYSSERSLWRDMARFRDEMERMLSSVTEQSGGAFPPVNVWVSEDSAVVTSELPGVAPDKLDISVVGDTLTLKGERPGEQLGEKDGYHRRERGTGRFARSLQLPFRVESNEVSASLRDGLLSITLPRAQADRPRKISISNA